MLSGLSSFKLASVPQKPDPPLNVASGTNENQISMQFGESLPDNGGADIINIQLWMDDSRGNFDIVQGFEDSLSLRTAKTFHKSDYPVIVKGKTFAFRTRVANTNGWSEFSDTTYVKVAEVPERP